MTDVRGKRVLVVGLARSGLAAARCLVERGAQVTVTDARAPWELRADIRELLTHKIGVELGQHREETFLNQDLIVISPGVLPELAQLQAARARSIPVVPEVEAASWFLESPIIGVTGSNGKTTTTALLGEILEASVFPTFVGGNIGVPLISAVGEVPREAFVVTELSSFQLETVQTFRPRVAVLLNITPNHLDRHPSLEAYIQAKSQIFKNQMPTDFAILNADDPAVMALGASSGARKILFSRRRELPEGVFVDDGHIYYRVGNLERVLLPTREILLRGDFNVDNVLAASAAACVLGADFQAIRRAVGAFRGVEHRLEFVREIRGVQFYNDSKATSVDAAAKALSAFNRGVHLILGGKGKGAPYAPLRALAEGRVRAVYLIGAAADRIAHELSGAVELVHCGELETAVREAYAHAVAGDVVLLSPACASFDQFQDYEHRGRVFKEVVARLAAEAEKPGLGIGESGFARPVGSAPAPSAERESQLVEVEPQRVEAAPEASPASAATEVHAGSPPEVTLTPVPAVGAPAEEPEPRAASPESRVSVPDRIYLYEVAAEEIEYPEPDLALDHQARDLELVRLDEVPAPVSLEDEALPFEVRPKPAATLLAGVATESQPQTQEESPDKPRDGSGPEPAASQGRLPGI